ncbi:phage/plasmid primase, P4 family [Streptobacillus felis]|uniref:phage/plasmid primase, P4 family n=1 Tax=Streptobacillus felis TaxID=1384509 RepID=UPI0008375F4A|nr:phage/plasmid primase, P4 family [Streptobacillus felis]
MKLKYIKLNNDKSPCGKYENTKYTTDNIEVAKKWDNIGLILPNNIIVVDFDSRGDIALDILKKHIELNKKDNRYKIPRAIKTTRGVHLYYQLPNEGYFKDFKFNNVSGIMTVLGCKVDYKTGQDNKKQYIIIKLNGVVREVLSDIELDNLPIIPIQLMPLVFKGQQEIVNLNEGSRNSELFKHLGNARWTYNKVFDNVEELTFLAHTINSYMIETLEPKEVDNIVKSVMSKELDKVNGSNKQFFSTTKNGNQKLDIFKLSDYLQEELKVTRYNGSLYFKINGAFTNDIGLLYTYLAKEIGLQLTKREDEELKHQLGKTYNEIDIKSDLPIVFNNGYAVTQKGEVIKYKSEQFTPYYLDVAYNPNAYSEDVDKFLKWFMCGDLQMVEYLKRILGHILITNNMPQFAFFFIGDSGANGKSTFFEIIRSVFNNVSFTLDLEELNRSDYLMQLNNKLVNLGDDIDSTYIEKSKSFKMVVSGNALTVRALYSTPETFKNQASLIFACNDMPNFKDKSGGIARRVRGIPCNAYIEESKRDIGLIKKLTTEDAKSYVLWLAIDGMRDILRHNGQMREPKEVLELSNQYIIDSDSVKSFIKYLNEDNLDYLDCEPFTVYYNYTSYCNDYGFKSLERSTFTKRFIKYLSLTTEPKRINGELKRVFVNK